MEIEMIELRFKLAICRFEDIISDFTAFNLIYFWWSLLYNVYFN